MKTTRMECLFCADTYWQIPLPSPQELQSHQKRPCPLFPFLPSFQEKEKEQLLLLLLYEEATFYLFSGAKYSATNLRTFRTLFRDVSQQLLREDYSLYQHSLFVLSLLWYFLSILSIPSDICSLICLAAFFHDVGKLRLPASLLSKSGSLTPTEWGLMKKHPIYGAKLLFTTRETQLGGLMVLHHHERWDGKGYPLGLSGQTIPLGARLIALIDTFAVLISGRPYRKQYTPREAFRELERVAGTQLDPLLVELFCIQSSLDMLTQMQFFFRTLDRDTRYLGNEPALSR